MTETAIVVFVTTANRDEALRLAEILVEKKLAACAQVLPEIVSIYRWQDVIRRDPETLLLIKTTQSRFAELEREVRARHSYDVPEIVAVKAAEISQPYFAWLVKETMSAQR
jgi:periplasmic divalent cation tolerance protein